MCPEHMHDGSDSDDGLNQPRKSGASRTQGRRSVLKGLFGVGSSASLAGCFGDGDGGSPTATAGGTPSDTASPTGRMESPTATATATQSQPSDDVPVVPPGGDIQAAIDDVAGGGASDRGNGPWGKVRLVTGKTYQIGETIRMRTGSILECNGARMVPTANVPVIDASASSYVKRPFIDARGVDGYDSPLIKVTTREGASTGNNPIIVEQMYLYGHRKHGAGVQVIDENEEGLGFSQLSGIIHHPKVGIHYRAVGEHSWVNSHQFDGWLRNNETAILMDSEPDRNAVNANIINVGIQPGEEHSKWFWDLQTGEENVVYSKVWDTQNYDNEKIWRIGDTAGQKNKWVDQSGNYRWDTNVVENRFGGAPNGAGGNVLFDYATAHAQLDLKNELDDIKSRLGDIES